MHLNYSVFIRHIFVYSGVLFLLALTDPTTEEQSFFDTILAGP